MQQHSLTESSGYGNPFRFDALSPSSAKFRVFDAVALPNEMRSGQPSEAAAYRPQLEDLLRQRNTEELLRHQNKEELHRHQQQQHIQQQLQLMQQQQHQQYQLQHMQQGSPSSKPPQDQHHPTSGR
jgi:hypothetical protein